MLIYLGVRREDVYITNAVKVRPDSNRTPTHEEIDSWYDMLLGELSTVQEEGTCIIVAMGAVAAYAILGEGYRTLAELRGKLHDVPLVGKVLFTYHPAYLLRNPAVKKESQKDLDILTKHVVKSKLRLYEGSRK